MRITPVSQYKKNSTNFKGMESKYSQKVMDVINSSIKESFSDVLPKAGKDAKEMGKVYDKITDGIGHVIGSATNTTFSKKCVEALNHFKKPSARMADLASFAITFFYVNNTRKSEKIPEERKMPLMVNNITVTAVSSTMAALIDKGSDVFLDRVKGAFYQEKGKQVLDEVIKKAPEVLEKGEDGIKELGKDILNSKEFRKGIRDYTKRVEKAKSLTIFSFTVRFLVTVLMVPVAGKIVEIIKEKTGRAKPKEENKEDKTENNKPSENTQNTPATEKEDDEVKTKVDNDKDDDDDEKDDDKD